MSLIGCKDSTCDLYAVYRGYCERHAPTERRRGYGPEWKAARAQVRREVRACQLCGAAYDLTVDHITPQSMGGTNSRANLRVLCRSCHATHGRKASSRVMT